MDKALKTKLNKVVKRLRPYKPEKIILYGSYAQGKARKDSDIDLLIIKRTKKRYFDRVNDIQKLLFTAEYYFNPKEDFIGDIDPIIYTPKELQERLRLGDFFVKRILREGKIIYEKT